MRGSLPFLAADFQNEMADRLKPLSGTLTGGSVQSLGNP